VQVNVRKLDLVESELCSRAIKKFTAKYTTTRIGVLVTKLKNLVGGERAK
jgi:hypothetical protein